MPKMVAGTHPAVREFRVDALQRLLRKHVDGEVRFDAAARVLYSTDASHYQIEPLGVVVPKTQAALAAAVAIACEQQVPIVPRGGGTSLSGQTVGAGVVIDCSRWLNRILETDVEKRVVRVEPGVVLAQLNKHLAPLGFQFGPDVSTIDRANMGGMIGNNSAGSRSVRYGKTIDHVVSLDALMTDGKRQTFASTADERVRSAARGDDRFAAVCRFISTVPESLGAEIERSYPKILRRVSGYNLDALLEPKP